MQEHYVRTSICMYTDIYRVFQKYMPLFRNYIRQANIIHIFKAYFFSFVLKQFSQKSFTNLVFDDTF